MAQWVVEDSLGRVVGSVASEARRIAREGGEALVVIEALADGYRFTVARAHRDWVGRHGFTQLVFAKLSIDKLALPTRLVLGVERPLVEFDATWLEELLHRLVRVLGIGDVYSQVGGIARLYMRYFGGDLDVRFMGGECMGCPRGVVMIGYY